MLPSPSYAAAVLCSYQFDISLISTQADISAWNTGNESDNTVSNSPARKQRTDKGIRMTGMQIVQFCNHSPLWCVWCRPLQGRDLPTLLLLMPRQSRKFHILFSILFLFWLNLLYFKSTLQIQRSTKVLFKTKKVIYLNIWVIINHFSNYLSLWNPSPLQTC